MTEEQWLSFNNFKTAFYNKTEEWKSLYQEKLKKIQEELIIQESLPSYPIQNPIVYNSALDRITKKDEIKLFLIADNPGKDEQLDINKEYLVGLSGKIAEGFFKKNPELQTDFRKNVIILNKTPIHTAKTNHLKIIAKRCPELASFIKESQIWMAEHTAQLHQDLCRISHTTYSIELCTKPCKNLPTIPQKDSYTIPELWLVGYSELKDKGIFIDYKESLLSAYDKSLFLSNVFVYQHFSMNRFSIDLTKEKVLSLSLKENLRLLGIKHRKEIFSE